MLPSERRHYIAKIDSKSRAYALLIEGAERAVIFVHGFFGNATSTWRDIQSLVDERSEEFPWWLKTDLYFYSYASENQVVPQARAFRDFLDASIFSRPTGGSFILRTFVLPSGFRVDAPLRFSPQYKDLILAGHSTGGVIIRQAILDEARNVEQITRGKTKVSVLPGSSLLLRSSLRLFAPAHRGAICSGPLGIALNIPVSETLLLLALRSKPLFQNIQPGSPVLEDIRRETESLQKKFSNEAFRPPSLFGDKDSIVNIGAYMDDPEPEIEQGHSHTSICKPNEDYTRPLRFFIDANSDEQLVANLVFFLNDRWGPDVENGRRRKSVRIASLYDRMALFETYLWLELGVRARFFPVQLATRVEEEYLDTLRSAARAIIQAGHDSNLHDDVRPLLKHLSIGKTTLDGPIDHFDPKAPSAFRSLLLLSTEFSQSPSARVVTQPIVFSSPTEWDAITSDLNYAKANPTGLMGQARTQLESYSTGFIRTLEYMEAYNDLTLRLQRDASVSNLSRRSQQIQEWRLNFKSEVPRLKFEQLSELMISYLASPAPSSSQPIQEELRRRVRILMTSWGAPPLAFTAGGRRGF